MLKIFAFLNRRPDLERAAFIEHYEQRHVPLVRSLAPTPLVYKRNYLLRGVLPFEDPNFAFDVVTEQLHRDRATFEAWLKQLSVPAIAEDEARFLDRSKTRAFAIEEYETPSLAK